MLHKIAVLKNVAIFTAKFIWTTTFGVTENITCLTGWKFTDVLQGWL